MCRTRRRSSQLKSLLTLLFCLTSLLSSTRADALTFRKNGEWIEVSGKFEPGDAARFAAFLKIQPSNNGGWLGVSLDSLGGSLAEGLLLGRFLRQNSIGTLVRQGNECYSACAIAFLGGTKPYTTGSGIGRNLEVGAKLGFHGFASSNERVVLLNEAFDAARIVNGLIVQYASEMRGIDLSLLAELISVEPTSIRVVSTPRELRGLSINVRGSLPPHPANWALNACSRQIELERPLKDGPLQYRISSQSNRKAVNSISEFRQLLLDDLYRGPTRDALAQLPAEDLVNLVVDAKPKLPIHRIFVQRGAGLYYDYCYAYESEYLTDSVQTILVSALGDGSKITKSHGPLGWYADNTTLWQR